MTIKKQELNRYFDKDKKYLSFLTNKSKFSYVLERKRVKIMWYTLIKTEYFLLYDSKLKIFEVWAKQGILELNLCLCERFSNLNRSNS